MCEETGPTRRSPAQAGALSVEMHRLHDAVAAAGSMPLTALERHVDWFVEQEREQ